VCEANITYNRQPKTGLWGGWGRDHSSDEAGLYLTLLTILPLSCPCPHCSRDCGRQGGCFLGQERSRMKGSPPPLPLLVGVRKGQLAPTFLVLLRVTATGFQVTHVLTLFTNCLTRDACLLASSYKYSQGHIIAKA
jgi:hypothetical protein